MGTFPLSAERQNRKLTLARFVAVLVVASLLAGCGRTTPPTDLQGLLADADKQRAAGAPEACIADYTKAIAADPALVKAFVGRAGCYLDEGHGGAAVQDYSQAIRLSNNDPSLYLQRGWAYQTVGNSSDARADYLKVSALSSASPSQIWQAAAGLGSMTFYYDSLTVLDIGLRAYPNNWFLHKNRADVEIQLGDTETALREFDVATKLAAGNDLATVLGDRGNFYLQRQKYTLAIADFGEGIRLNNEAYDLYEGRAKARLGLGDLLRAEADFGAAIDLYRNGGAPDKGTLIRLLEERGKLYLQEGRRDKALADFKQALTVVPPSDAPDRERLTAEIASAGG